MASQRKRQSPEQIKPGYSDDPFCHQWLKDYDEEHGGNEPEPANVRGYLITGLSDEADAKRYLGLKFNTALQFCRSCEIVVEGVSSGQCFGCGECLVDVGSKPYSYHKKWSEYK